jgi:beta-phosphoglucomutase
MRGLLLDFNGTLSNDEQLLCEIFQRLFEQEGKSLTTEQYYDELVGLSDAEIVERWLGSPRPDVVKRKIDEYRKLVPMYEPIDQVIAIAVRDVARRISVAIVSGSSRAEIELGLEQADLTSAISVIVAGEDVLHGKPDPEGYRRALHLLRLAPTDCVAVEDSDTGVAAAKKAGLHCVGIANPYASLADADERADSLYDAIARIGLHSP